jgi:hypothetical protein
VAGMQPKQSLVAVFGDVYRYLPVFTCIGTDFLGFPCSRIWLFLITDACLPRPSFLYAITYDYLQLSTIYR